MSPIAVIAFIATEMPHLLPVIEELFKKEDDTWDKICELLGGFIQVIKDLKK